MAFLGSMAILQYTDCIFTERGEILQMKKIIDF